MKKWIMGLITLVFVIQIQAQKKYAVNNFNEVELNNINGEVKISLADSFSVVITGLLQNDSVLQVKVVPNNKLIITMNKGLGWDYMQQQNVKLYISMPLLTKVLNNSNADVFVSTIKEKKLVIENSGNGQVVLKNGCIEYIEIENYGNGDVKANKVETKKVKVAKYGNGDVLINTDASFEAWLMGNGNIVNYGLGKAIIKKQSGNGELLYKK